MKQIEVIDLGFRAYKSTWDLQKQIQAQLIEEKLRLRKDSTSTVKAVDYLLFVEHPHVYTLGKSGDEANLLRSNEQLRSINAEFVPIDRGGDITYHGPGQIVGYPILDLDRYGTDLHIYLRNLEEVIIRTIKGYGINGNRIEKITGVWVEQAKVCAMGIKCSRWVTMHGFALNVNTEMEYFDHIIPCGIRDKSVTSLQQLLGKEIDMNEVKDRLVLNFREVFQIDHVLHTKPKAFMLEE